MGVTDYLCMVESHWRQLAERPPTHLGGIIASNCCACINSHSISCRHSTAARVTARSTVNAYQPQVAFVHSDSGLFLEFAHSAMLYGLIHLHESTRQCPAAFEWFATTAHQQQFTTPVHHGAVGRKHRPLVFVDVCSFDSHLVAVSYNVTHLVNGLACALAGLLFAMIHDTAQGSIVGTYFQYALA